MSFMYFVLTPDSLSAIQLRNVLARQYTTNITVGSFQVLLDLLYELWILPYTDTAEEQIFQQQLRVAALGSPSAFWSKSLQVDEHAVLEDLSQSLVHLYEHLPLNKNLSTVAPTLQSEKQRVNNYLSDLIDLAGKMNNLRPFMQEKAKKWLVDADLSPIQPLKVILPKATSIPIWQRDIINKLNNNYPLDTEGRALQAKVDSLFQSSLSGSPTKRWVEFLFKNSKESITENDERLSIISTRDVLEECEVLVSRVQQATEKGVRLDEIAIVTPSDSYYQQLLPNLFNQAGIAYSNLGNKTEYFEWDKQLLKDLIQLYAVFQNEEIFLQPVQLGSVLVNPLMPWSLEYGQWLFEKYQYSGNFKFVYDKEKTASRSESLIALIELISGSNLGSLSEWIDNIIDLLNFEQSPELFNKKKLKAYFEEINDNFTAYTLLSPLDALTKKAQQIVPKHFSINTNEDTWYLDSVLMLHERNTLILPVKHLFILGFNEGAFEPNLSSPGVFQKDDWQTVQQLTDLNVHNKLVRDDAFALRFKRFLNLAIDGIHISLSEQEFDGSRLAPSQTLIDLAIGLQPINQVEPLALITPIKTQPNHIAFINFIEQQLALPVVKPDQIEDLMFDKDLIALHKDSNGNIRTESPSSLDKLMVSPLAWLLDRQGIKDKSWDVQDLSVSLLGTVAHKVFELHFDPSVAYSLDNYDALFNAAISAEAEFLNNSKWRMERKQLKQETQQALVPFVEWCEQEGWHTEMQEGRLTGNLFGLPIKGFVDAVFKKDDKRLILDYKKSKSNQFAKRLENGFDLQTMIYRKLIAQKEKSTSVTHSGYFTLNDQTFVLDTEVSCSVKALSQKPTKTSIDEQSQAAKGAVSSRIKELRAGIIKINHKNDVKQWDQLGVSSAKYAIDDNPLVSAFVKEEETEQSAIVLAEDR